MDTITVGDQVTLVRGDERLILVCDMVGGASGNPYLAEPQSGYKQTVIGMTIESFAERGWSVESVQHG